MQVRGRRIRAQISDPYLSPSCWMAWWPKGWRTASDAQSSIAIPLVVCYGYCSAPTVWGGEDGWCCSGCWLAWATSASPPQPSISPRTYPAPNRLSGSACPVFWCPFLSHCLPDKQQNKRQLCRQNISECVMSLSCTWSQMWCWQDEQIWSQHSPLRSPHAGLNGPWLANVAFHHALVKNCNGNANKYCHTFTSFSLKTQWLIIYF